MQAQAARGSLVFTFRRRRPDSQSRAPGSNWSTTRPCAGKGLSIGSPEIGQHPIASAPSTRAPWDPLGGRPRHGMSSSLASFLEYAPHLQQKKSDPVVCTLWRLCVLQGRALIAAWVRADLQQWAHRQRPSFRKSLWSDGRQALMNLSMSRVGRNLPDLLVVSCPASAALQCTRARYFATMVTQCQVLKHCSPRGVGLDLGDLDRSGAPKVVNGQPDFPPEVSMHVLRACASSWAAPPGVDHPLAVSVVLVRG